MIERTFLAEQRWMGEIGLRIHGRLEWAPSEFLRSVLTEMRDQGILIEQRDHPRQQRNPISIYYLTRLTMPATYAWAEGGQG